MTLFRSDGGRGTETNRQIRIAPFADVPRSALEPLDVDVIAFLAKKATLPLDEVRRLYEHEWTALESAARIKGFVPILTVRGRLGYWRQNGAGKAGTALSVLELRLRRCHILRERGSNL